jgi:hypothetical protein
VLIEPGNIRTNFASTAQDHPEAIFSDSDSPYRALYHQYLKVTTAMRQRESGPEVVCQAVQHAIEAFKPKARCPVAVPFSNRLVLHLGDPARDFVFRRMFKIASAAE